MTPREWRATREAAVAEAFKLMLEGQDHFSALDIAASIFDLDVTKTCIVAADLHKVLRPTVHVSQDTGNMVDILVHDPLRRPAKDANVDVLFLDWSEITPQDWNPVPMNAWLENVEIALRGIRGATGIPGSQRLGDAQAIEQHLEENEPDALPDDLDQSDPSVLTLVGIDTAWTACRQLAADLVADLGGAQ